eukprot:jgi/Tetstr1/424783/TSEL_001480.t1
MLAQLAAGLGLTAAPLRAPEAELQAFLDGLRIVRRSFKPSGAREAANRRYLELGCRGDSAPPTLTWTIPPGHAAGWAEWYRGQAGTADSIRGVYTPGLRVNTAALLMSPHVPSDLKAQLLEGAPLMWTGRPPRSRKNNYKSCFDNNNAAGVDFDRIIALGFCEGPLHYLPWIVNPIACIIKTVPTYKVRNVVDFKQSGVNDCLARVSCQLSDIHGVLEALQPGDALGKIDLTDAFFCWPTASSDCDYQGFQHPATGEYYRYRYVPFGNRQAPALQQRWAHVIRDILLREGLQFCVPGSPEASYANFGVAGTYLDDFLLKFNSSLSLWQQGLMYLSCVNTRHKYGLPVKLAKNEWPSTRCEFVGVLIDTVRGTVAVSAARCGKLRARADALLTEVDVAGTTARGALASFIGKVQWTCPVVLPGQAHLVGLYRARDCLVSAASTNPIDSWDPAEPCCVDPAARADLLWWRDTLTAGASRMTPSPSDPIQPLARSYRRVPAFPGLWSKAMIPRLPGDPQLPLDGSAGFEVITSDASGWAGGVWWGDVRLHYAFTPEQLQQWSTSANLRELFMVPWTISQIGARLAGSNVLFRLDNTSSVGAVNKGASPHPDSLELLLWLLELLERFDIALIARHIPGRQNTLADSLSRLRGAIDDQDWRLLSDIFRALEAACGPFDVDACADPLGRNSFCPAFWSAIDSCLAHDWAGRRVYCNPPFAAMRDVLRHFWACYATAPSTTAGTFVLPVWAAAPWWRLAGGAQVIAYFRRGHTLFTSPEWRDASRTNPVPSRREYRGPTTWGVVLIHVPPAGPIDSLSAQATIAMPRRCQAMAPGTFYACASCRTALCARLRDYCSFCTARGATPLPATLGLLRGYIYHCTSDRSLAPSTIAGRLAAISDWHRRQLPHLRLAGRSTLNPCKDESINTLISILERRTVRPAKGRLPLPIPDLRAMLHRGFPLPSAFGRHQRMCITFLNPGCLRRAAAAALTCDYRVSSSGAVSYTDLSAVRVLFNAELGCRYIRMRVDVDKNVDARHECFAYIPDHVPCLAVRPVDMLEDYLRVFRPPSGSRLLAAPKSSRIGPQTFHTTPYSGFNSAFKAAYARAFPDPATRTTPLDRVGSHSGRKSLAQWLWDRYRSARVIAHVGHWACRQDALDAYFKTSATEILRLIAAL